MKILIEVRYHTTIMVWVWNEEDLINEIKKELLIDNYERTKHIKIE